MVVLLLFAFLAGIVTVLSPCIIPILPAILSGGADHGKARPLGIILGLVVSFSFFTLALSEIITVTGISANILRYVAITIIALFGIIMIFPKLGDIFSRLTSGFANIGSKLQTPSTPNSGFLSGALLGISLGLVWTPCAGPILAAVITLVASKHISLQAILITVAYAIGAGIPLFFIAYGGNKAVNSSRFLSAHAENIRKAFGVIMLLTALAMASNLDRTFQLLSLSALPSISIENNSAVQNELAKLRQQVATKVSSLTLGNYGKAPEFSGITHWLNTSGPLTMTQLRGKVVLIDFWTYSCINCIRTLPFVTKWYETYKDTGFVVVGVHTPEFEFEKETANVAQAIAMFHIAYPVAQDNVYGTWNAYSNQYWPADYLIDKQGNIRYEHFGEGDYVGTENAIRTLLNEPVLSTQEPTTYQRPVTAETYLGYDRASAYTAAIPLIHDQDSIYSFQTLTNDQVGITGHWIVGNESIFSNGTTSSLSLDFLATKVHLVLSGTSTLPITIDMDNKPMPKQYYSQDMDSKGQIFVNQDRKYDLIDLKQNYGRHVLTIHIPQGIRAYAFTFTP